MPYCRFQNTLADLRECNEWLADHEPSRDLSEDELKAFNGLVKLCRQIVDNFE
jgi:hypothetical protein